MIDDKDENDTGIRQQWGEMFDLWLECFAITHEIIKFDSIPSNKHFNETDCPLIP